ncbi:MAG: hypothetical protein AB1Z98_15975 [Nannocystaceae bacterium]
MQRRNDFMKTAALLALPLALGLGCGADMDEMGAPLEADADDDALPAGPDALSTQREVGVYPGFAFEISVSGDDVVLDWSASDTGLGANIPTVTRATSVEGLDAPGADQFVLAADTTSFTDAGAADQNAPTPTYFYRVDLSGPGGTSAQSTVVAKVSTETAKGYVNFGMCVLDGPQVASEIDALIGDSVISVHVWNEQTQSWIWWWSDDGAGPFGDFALPFGGMVTVNLNDSAPDYVSIVGTVPTNEPGLGPVEGLNYLTTPLVGELEASTASGFVDGLGWYEGVGVWDVNTQTANWYYGPGDSDFSLEACRPYKFQGAPDPCTADGDCNEGQYCAFEIADACGVEGEGTCTAVPLAVCGAEDEPVCGCDDTTYANECEAATAGVSVATAGACSICITDPCANGGECIASGDNSSFTCVCASGFTGPDCTTPYDACGGEVEDLGSTVPQSVLGISLEGLNDDLDSVCSSTGGPDRAYTFTAPAAGGYRFDTVGSAALADTVLAVLNDCGGPELSCNDDADVGLLSEIDIVMEAGETVTIVLDTFGPPLAGSLFQLNVSEVVIDESVCGCFADSIFAAVTAAITAAPLACSADGNSIFGINPFVPLPDRLSIGEAFGRSFCQSDVITQFLGPRRVLLSDTQADSCRDLFVQAGADAGLVCE